MNERISTQVTRVIYTKNTRNMKECKPDKHKPRDNKLGITWCVKCGRLFTKPCGKELKEADKLIIKINTHD